MKLRVAVLLMAVALIAVGVWSISRRGKRGRTPATKSDISIQDGKTIDFSSGNAVVKDSAKEKAALDRSVAEMNAAASNVTFSSQPSPAAASDASAAAAASAKK